MADRDYYTILEVNRSATPEQIKRAYRGKAKEYHPDRNPGDASAEARFKEVQQAHNVLSDPEKRAQYDQFGKAGVGQWAPGHGGQRVYHWGTQSSIDADDLEDLLSAFGGGRSRGASVFEQIFGGGRRGRVAPPSIKRGEDEEHRVTLTFEQAINGTTVALQVRSPRSSRGETIEVKIPPGVEEGQKIRVKGKGRPGHGGGPPGDLFLICCTVPHAYFRRQGPDIYVDVPVSVTEAALGGKVEVPTLDGRATVTLPPGTPGGAKLRLRGRGVAQRGRSQRGDQYVVINIVPPRALTDEQRATFEKLREQDQSDPRAQCPW